MQRRTAIAWGGVGAGFAGLGLALLAFSTVSCGTTLTEYEPYPVYPFRRDPLVVANPPSQPAGPAEAGKLDDWLLAHNARGGRVYDPKTLMDVQRSSIETTLGKLFGTPAAPKVDSPDPAVASLKLTEPELAEGSKLYRRHCANCHGLTCDGRGPAGLFVYPHPRDVRLGTMKFVSTADGSGVPTRADLERIIRAGVPGTSMPPFNLADDAVIEKLTTATIHLSLRGEVESKLLRSLLDDGDGPPDDYEAEARRLLDKALARWAGATAIVVPPSIPGDDESIRRGHALFVSAKAGCLSCHEDYGRKDAYRYDAWGTAARVANLTERAFRGGGDPDRLFERIRGGIPTVGMPAQPGLTDGEVRDLVHFVQSASTPAMLPADVRAKVYP